MRKRTQPVCINQEGPEDAGDSDGVPRNLENDAPTQAKGPTQIHMEDVLMAAEDLEGFLNQIRKAKARKAAPQWNKFQATKPGPVSLCPCRTKASWQRHIQELSNLQNNWRECDARDLSANTQASCRPQCVGKWRLGTVWTSRTGKCMRRNTINIPQVGEPTHAQSGTQGSTTSMELPTVPFHNEGGNNISWANESPICELRRKGSHGEWPSPTCAVPSLRWDSV